MSHKRILLVFAFTFIGFILKAAEKDSIFNQKKCYDSAYLQLSNMLSGNDTLSYEKAVFITENAYYNNQVNYRYFQALLDLYTMNIIALAEANRNEAAQNFKPKMITQTEKEKRELYNTTLYNWAIYKFFTDTTALSTNINDTNYIIFHLPFTYPYSDPFGTINIENTQIINLLSNSTGNCYAQASLFKILSERLKTNADICTAPGHIYITHQDINGIEYNIELPTHSFPGCGSIMTLTYTPLQAVQNGIALRKLDNKQAVALCLISLAKSYENKFKTKTDDFIIHCAETALQYDTLNLNAMLLKAEVLEEKLINKNKTITQLQTDKEFKQYQSLIVKLYKKGYREMPLDMKNIIINKLQKDSAGFVLIDHTPKGFQTINPKDDRYATLSWGMFDEVHEPKLIEQYGRTLLNTKTNKITKFVDIDSTYNKYQIDPVVSAWQIDPLTSKNIGSTPYNAFANNPLLYVDPDGKDSLIVHRSRDAEIYGKAKIYKITFSSIQNGVEKPIDAPPMWMLANAEAEKRGDNSLNNKPYYKLGEGRMNPSSPQDPWPECREINVTSFGVYIHPGTSVGDFNGCLGVTCIPPVISGNDAKIFATGDYISNYKSVTDLAKKQGYSGDYTKGIPGGINELWSIYDNANGGKNGNSLTGDKWLLKPNSEAQVVQKMSPLKAKEIPNNNSNSQTE